jgi:hypothetical protein
MISTEKTSQNRNDNSQNAGITLCRPDRKLAKDFCRRKRKKDEQGLHAGKTRMRGSLRRIFFAGRGNATEGGAERTQVREHRAREALAQDAEKRQAGAPRRKNQ